MGTCSEPCSPANELGTGNLGRHIRLLWGIDGDGLSLRPRKERKGNKIRWRLKSYIKFSDNRVSTE